MGKKGGNGASNGDVIEKQVGLERLPSTEENETVSNKSSLLNLPIWKKN